MSAQNESSLLFRDAWKLMAGRLPESTITEQDGLANCFSNTPLSFLNLSIYDQPIADLASLDNALVKVVDAAAACPFAWLHALCIDKLPEGWEETAAAHSLASMMQLAGMETDGLLPSVRPLPTLEWRPVADLQSATDMAHLNAIAYGMPTQLFDPICNLHIWQADTVAIVGYLDGIPVTSAAALPIRNTIYIALVATHPDHRGKGYAEACIRQTVDAATGLMGLSRLSLHASEAGRPLYAQMGFEASSKFALLTLVQPESTGH
jgi:GNAT superfamily N-acetyltransferase